MQVHSGCLTMSLAGTYVPVQRRNSRPATTKSISTQGRTLQAELSLYGFARRGQLHGKHDPDHSRGEHAILIYLGLREKSVNSHSPSKWLILLLVFSAPDIYLCCFCTETWHIIPQSTDHSGKLTAGLERANAWLVADNVSKAEQNREAGNNDIDADFHVLDR